VRCWGGNASGQIAAPADSNVRLAPVAITDLAGVTSISAGDYHSCAVLTGGGVRCWAATISHSSGRARPAILPAGHGHPDRVAEIAVADSFSCARTTSGTVRCWGYAVALGQPNQLDGTQPSTTGLANIVAVTAAATPPARSTEPAPRPAGASTCKASSARATRTLVTGRHP